ARGSDPAPDLGAHRADEVDPAGSWQPPGTGRQLARIPALSPELSRILIRPYANQAPKIAAQQGPQINEHKSPARPPPYPEAKLAVEFTCEPLKPPPYPHGWPFGNRRIIFFL